MKCFPSTWIHNTYNQVQDRLVHVLIKLHIYLFGSDYVNTTNKKNDWEKSTPIRGIRWPTSLSGSDLVALAQKSSGKTLSFVLPANVLWWKRWLTNRHCYFSFIYSSSLVQRSDLVKLLSVMVTSDVTARGLGKRDQCKFSYLGLK